MTARDQSDAVALAVDSPGWRSDTAKHGNPFANPVWVKNCIASGSIIPPQGESAAVRLTDFKVGLCVICLAACGIVAMGVAYFGRW